MSDITLYDSQTSFQGGMQNGFDAAQVGEHQYFRGINVQCREGVIDPRPSFQEMTLDSSDLIKDANDIIIAEGNRDDAQTALTTAQGNYDTQAGITDTAKGVYDTAYADATAAFALIAQDRTNYYPALAGIFYNGSSALYDLADTWTAIDSPTDDAETAALVVSIDAAILAGDTAEEIFTDYGLRLMEIATPSYSVDSSRDAAIAASMADYANYIAAHNAYLNELATYDLWQAELPILADLQTVVDDATAYLEQMQGILDRTFNSQWVFLNGKFQGMKEYSTRNKSYLVMVISGHIFLVNLIEQFVSCLTDGVNQLDEFTDRCYFCQTENFMIIQDGVSLPKILEGAEMRDADPTVPEIPTGTRMAYGHGRLAIQVSPRHLMLSDIYLAYEPENVLKMKETRFLNEGGGFTVSGRLGRIIALEYANVSDTSTGDGPLLAICENGFSTFAVNNPRRTWMDIGIQKVQLLGTGIVGHEALCNINEDILYRSHEGIRSYAVGRKEAASAYKYTELSREMEPYIRGDSGYDARFLSMSFFDKRMLALTTPLTIKAKASGYVSAEDDYNTIKAAVLLLDATVTDGNITEKYQAQLDWIIANTVTWTEVAPTTAGWVTQQLIDIAAAENQYPYIETLVENATSDVDVSETDKLAALKAFHYASEHYYTQIVDDVCFKGIIGFDFSLAGFTKSTSEDQYKRATTGSYDGIWTGIRPCQLATTIIESSKRCFAFVKNDDGTNGLYEITKEITGYDSGTKKIESVLELRAMPFKAEQTYVPAPFVNKKLEDITLWFTGIEDDVDVEIQVSSDVVNAFTKVGQLSLKALTRSSDVPPAVGAPQSRAMFSLKDMKDDLYDPNTKHPVRQGNEFQFRLIWSGKVRLRRFFTAARKIANEDDRDNIETAKAAYPVDSFNQYRYSSKS